MNLDIINKVLASEYESEPICLEDLKFIQDFVNIILEDFIDCEVPIYRVPVKKNMSIKYSLDFLKTLNKRYAYDLEEAMEKGFAIFKEVSNFYEVSSTIYNSSIKNIYFTLTGYIFDAYSLTHETIHYTSLDIKNITTNWRLTTEAYAMTAETLQSQYFENINPNLPEYKFNDYSNLAGILEKTCMIDFELGLMKIYLIKKYIDENDIQLLLKGKSDYYIECAMNDIEFIEENYNERKILELNFGLLQNYIIGYILSTHILSRISENKKYRDQFVELIDNSNEMSFVDTLKTVNLEVVDEETVILSDESIKFLKREYKKRMEDLF